MKKELYKQLTANPREAGQMEHCCPK
jgi:hypothetical protein